MQSSARSLIGCLLPFTLVCGILLISYGVYGWCLFYALPMLLGAIASWVDRPKFARDAIRTGIVAIVIASVILIGVKVEGIFCVVMALPNTLPAGALGAWIVYEARRYRVQTGSAAMLVLLPFGTFTYDVTAHPPVYAVRSSVEIAASPEQVWKHVVSFPDLPEPKEWYFRGGIAYPQRARIEGTGPGAVRYCEFSTGPFVEPIEVWDEPRLLRFRVTHNPAPMREWSPYGDLDAKHLHGYMISEHGQFRLTQLGRGRTLLEGTTWYRHSLWPAEYWRVWSDAIIHRIHLRVLNHIRALAEADAATYAGRTTK